MENTAEQLRSKSENLVRGLQQPINMLKTTNADITVQIKQNEERLLTLEKEYEMTVAKLRAENIELAKIRDKNDALVAKFESVLNAE